ncbi:MAG: hypothetical protein II949_11830 [Prevotella sp.]|nr:hypothetical protein [Prevotella sp.]
MNKLRLKDNSDYEIIKSWCLTIYDYLMSIDSAYTSIVYHEYGFMSIIRKADKTRNLKLIKALYKETNLYIREDLLTSKEMTELNQLLKEKFGHNIADEIDRETALIEKIIKRGNIRNDREFEMVKRREEEIYADESQNEYAETLRKLMGDYECPQLSVRSD